MSKESAEWLNTQVLCGMTDKVGLPWHYDPTHQSDESNCYPGAIPPEDVQRRLFHWTPELVPVEATILTEDGVTRVSSPTKCAVVRPDTRDILGIVSSKYSLQPFQDVLLAPLTDVLGDDVVIRSAGLLQRGGLGWVQIETPETADVNDVHYRPYVILMSSLTGELPHTIGAGTVAVVCDNTFHEFLRSPDSVLNQATKHYVHSRARVVSRTEDMLKRLTVQEDSFAATVRTLTSITVSQDNFDRWLEIYVPLGEKPTKNKATIVETKRDQLRTLWTKDPRVAPWKGTAYGVVAAGNTWNQWLSGAKQVQGMTSAENRFTRNMLDRAKGTVAADDAMSLKLLAKAGVSISSDVLARV